MEDKKITQDVYDLVIIGSGVAGLAAGLYAGRYRLKTAVIGEPFGGETASAGTIENYPGNAGVDGYELASVMRKQADGVGTKVLDEKAILVERNEHCFVVCTASAFYPAHSIILAGGAERRRLGLPNEQALTGRGVHYCITCDGPLYKNKTIAIVGGGDASVKGVNLAAAYAAKIYLIVRGKEIIAEPINREQMERLGSKVEIIFDNSVSELAGNAKLDNIVLAKSYEGSNKLQLDGLFVEIGAVPNTEIPKSLGVELDDKGYVKTDSMMRTNVHGVFAAGDMVNFFGRFKQAVTAAAMGAVAATSAYEDRQVHGELCPVHWRPKVDALQAKNHNI